MCMSLVCISNKTSLVHWKFISIDNQLSIIAPVSISQVIIVIIIDSTIWQSNVYMV